MLVLWQLIAGLVFQPALLRRGQPDRPLALRMQPARPFTPLMLSGNDEAVREPPQKLMMLMVQCAVQAQLAYYNEFKNELRAKWLESFLGQDQLQVQRTATGKGGGRLVYRGLSNGLRDVSWREYLGTMLRGSPQEYKCRYAEGTADTAGGPGATARSAAAAGAGNVGDGVIPGWAAASASRAQNPYLQQAKPQYREYSEMIVPRTVAQGLLSICRQLGSEWAHDLRLIAYEGEYLRRACEDCMEDGAEACLVNDDSVNTMMLLGDAANVSRAVVDLKIDLPPFVYASLRAATAAWYSDLSEAPSPFRAENFDLLQRAVTREAALSTLAALEADESGSQAAGAAWLRERLEGEWLPRFEAPSRNQLAGFFLVELLATPPTARTAPGGKGLGFVDPAAIAQQVIAEREVIATEWAAQLETDVNAALQALLAADLEEQLTSSESLYPGLPPDPEFGSDEW